MGFLNMPNRSGAAAFFEAERIAVRVEISYKIFDWKEAVPLQSPLLVVNREDLLVAISQSQSFGSEVSFGLGPPEDYTDVFFGLQIELLHHRQPILNQLELLQSPYRKESQVQPSITPATGKPALRHHLSGSLAGVFFPCFVFRLFPIFANPL